MAEQLVFELAPSDPPSFGDYLPGRNAEAVTALQALASGRAAETGFVLWGPPGVGKSHLLCAVVGAATDHGISALMLATPHDLPLQETEAISRQTLVAVDDIDRATPEAQSRLFSLFNALRDRGGHLLVASRTPLAALPLREDLRTRLGWGLVYELTPLADEDKPAALAAFARQRGFRLTDDVVAYLLAHVRRDMPALLATLAALDRYSLSTRRPVTLAMLRDWLQQNLQLGRSQ